MAEGEVALLYEDEEEQQKQEQTKAEDGAEDTKDVPAVMVKEEARAESSAHACSAEEEADRSAEGNVVHQGTAGTELKMEGENTAPHLSMLPLASLWEVEVPMHRSG